MGNDQFNSIWPSALRLRLWRRGAHAQRAGLLLLAALLMACSPALNWREVAVPGGLKAWLPCKPERAQRQVPLAWDAPAAQAGAGVLLHRAGCEADGAMYAVSVLAIPASAKNEDLQRLQAQWQAAALAQMQPGAAQVRQHASPAVRGLAHGMSTGAAVLSPLLLYATGQRADGQPLQAALLWFSAPGQLYHVAVYGAVVRPEHTEILLTQLQLP